MKDRYIYTSLTRISNLEETGFRRRSLEKAKWATGDYVVCQVNCGLGGNYMVELCNGRMANLMNKDLLVGALGVRHATLEATGSWEEVGGDGKMHLLTGAGLFGKMTSRSYFIDPLTRLQYLGHVMVDGKKCNMKDYVLKVPPMRFDIPVVLMVGTSMSAGKTTAARIVTFLLKQMGLKVVAAKLAGAGRYKDVISMRDAGAEYIFDFVDVGLPSTICPPEEFRVVLPQLLSRMAASGADIAVVEIGSSPLEPYNGDIAIEAIREQVRCTVLCASDPYAVYGVMKSFEVKPSIVTGPASNTLGGVDLIQKLCKVRALNLVDPDSHPVLRSVLQERLEEVIV